MQPNDHATHAANLIAHTIAKIQREHPNDDQGAIEAFVKQRFDFANNDPSGRLVPDEVISQYRNQGARATEDSRVAQEDITTLLFNGLASKPGRQHLQEYELREAFRTTTGNSLNDYLPELDAVLEQLAERRYVRREKPGARMAIFIRGTKFGDWDTIMRKPQTAAQITNHVTVSGNNARFTQHGNDNSTNSIVQNAAVTDQLEALRRTVAAAPLSDVERVDADDLVDAIDAAFAGGKPKKSVVKSCLDSLGALTDVAKFADALLPLIKDIIK